MDKSKELCEKYGINRDGWVGEDKKYREVIYWSSAGHFVEVCEAASKDKELWGQKNNNGKNTYFNKSGEWTHGDDFKTYESAKEAILNGTSSPRMIESIDKLRTEMLNRESVKQLLQRAETYKRKRVFKEQGDDLCIDRVLSGSTEHWASLTKGKKSSIVQLHVCLTISSGTSWKMHAKFAAATAIACELLQTAGFFTEVWVNTQACDTLSGNGAPHEQGDFIKLKDASESFDINRIGTMGVTTLYRGYGFSSWVNFFGGEVANYGLGRVVPMSDEMRKRVGVEFLFDTDFKTDEQTVMYLDELLQKVHDSH